MRNLGGASPTTRISLAMLAVSLLLGLLMLSAPDQLAAAQQVTIPVCVSGALVDGSCQVRTDQPPECVPDTCARVVERPADCAPGACATFEPAAQGPPICPDGASGTVDFCFIYAAKGPNGCEAISDVHFELDDGNCAQEVALAAGAYSCPDGGRLWGVNCRFAREPVYGFCPAPSEPVEGACIDFAVDGLSANCGLLNEDFVSLRCIEPTAVLPAEASTCEAPAEFVEDRCLEALPGVAVRYCDLITEPGEWLRAENGQCGATTAPTVATCPAAFSRADSLTGSRLFEPGTLCFRFEPSSASCPEGELNASGNACFVPTSECPDGYQADSSLNGICARFEPAEQGEQRCPDGSQEDERGCYILVAFGPRGPGSCAEGTLQGSFCIIEGDPPDLTQDECPVSSTVFLIDGVCYNLVSPNPDGSCPTFAMVINDRCSFEIPLQPGPAVCADTFAFFDGRCLKFVTADSAEPTCPQGAVQIDQECRQPVSYREGDFFCADPAAALNGRTCAFTTAPIPTDGAECSLPRGTLTTDGKFCILGPPQNPDCGDGEPLDRNTLCVYGTTFDTFTCPAGTSPLEPLYWAGCVRFLPSTVSYECGPAENVLTIDNGTPTCWAPTGLQPGDCPGVTRDGQCFGFVDHQLVCAPAGCAATTPPVEAAPLAEQLDVNCDNVRDLKDALVLAAGVAQPDLARETTCAAVAASGGMRVTAADLIADGTVDDNDVRRLLQCIVDDNVAACVP